MALAGIFLSSSSPSKGGVPVDAAEAVNAEAVEATPTEEAPFPSTGGAQGSKFLLFIMPLIHQLPLFMRQPFQAYSLLIALALQLLVVLSMVR